jgi:hypothetical protein
MPRITTIAKNSTSNTIQKAQLPSLSPIETLLLSFQLNYMRIGIRIKRQIKEHQH